MLTRAYDTIMAALQTPMITYENVDFNKTTIDDGILNCKSYSGAVRTCAGRCLVKSGGVASTPGTTSYTEWVPFASFAQNTVIPDEDESAPAYEDYAVAGGAPTGWTCADSACLVGKSYDDGTKEFICAAKIKWQNTSGTAKTVYGLKIKGSWYYRSTYSDTSFNTETFLFCREHFPSPVVVEDQGIIQLTFTWRVGRAGLVSNTSADAE